MPVQRMPDERRSNSRWAVLPVAALLAACGDSGSGPPQEVAVAWTGSDGAGHVGIITTAAPWGLIRGPVDTGANALLQCAGPGKFYLLSRSTGVLSEVDGRSLHHDELALFLPDDDVEDFTVADGQVWVTRRSSPRLARVDLAIGVVRESVDFSAYADADGNPDLGTLLADDGRLYVQIRRHNADEPWGQAAPAYIGVVDTATETIVDADPVTPGVQAIALEGQAPKHRMQLVPERNRLAVSASGTFFDRGGIELIDISTLQSLGLAVREEDGLIGADLGPLIMAGPDRGFLEFSTDFDLSSHLVEFRFGSPARIGPQLIAAVGYAVPALAHAARHELLFVPEGGSVPEGYNVFDAATGERLSAETIALDGRPTDLIVLCE